MSLSGTTNTYLPPTLDGLNIIEADAIYINGIPIDTENLVPYTNATKNVNLGTFNFQTLGSITAKQHVFPTFPSTMMTSPTTSSIFYADAWEFNNTIQISSLGGGSFVSTSYLRLADGSNNSTLLTLQSDGIADFGNSIPRASTLATGNYDLVNLSTLSNAVAYLEGITSLNFVPYVGSLNNLDMGGSTITTTGLMSAGAVRITSSLSNIDYAISVNGSDQLEFTNLTTLQTLKTDGASLFIPGNVNCYSGTVFSNDLQLSGTSFLAYGTASQFGTTLNSSGEYEIQDDAGVMRLRLSKSTGLTVSTLNITQVPSATPTYALGVNGGGSVVSFAVPTATNLLPLNNTWTGTNRFNNSVLLNTGTAQGSLTVYNSTDSLPGGGSGSALAIFAPISTDSALIFGCSANTTFAIRSSGSLSNPTLAIYSPVIPGMLTFTQNEATMTHGGNSFSLGNTRFLTSTVNSGVSSASVLAVSPTTISSSGGTYTALANSTTTEFRMRIVAEWIGGVNYTLTMVNTNWSNIKAPILITVQSPAGTTIGSATPTLGGTSQVLFTYPQGANGNIYIYIYYAPLGPTPSFNWTTLSVVANVLRSNLYSTKTAMAVNTTVPSFAGLALQSITAPNGAGNETTIENFIVGDVSAGTKYPKGYSVGFNAGNLAATIVCQQASAGAGTTFYSINQQASYHSWKSRPNTANSVDMVLDYNAGNGGLRLNKNGAGRTTTALLDVAGDTTITGNFRKENSVNPTTTNLNIYDGGAGNTPYIDWTLSGTRKAYLGYATATVFDFAVENGAALNIKTNGSTRLDIQAGGLININNGLNVAGGEIVCPNQPFVIVGAVGGASIGYGAGTNFGSGGYLYAYTSAGYSNTPGSGWATAAGRFWATKTGRYQVNFCFYWNNFAGGSRAVMTHYNGAGALLETRYCALWGAGIGSDTTQNYSTIVYMDTGNFLQFQFQSGSGTLYFGGITHTHCSFHFIA